MAVDIKRRCTLLIRVTAGSQMGLMVLAMIMTTREIGPVELVATVLVTGALCGALLEAALRIRDRDSYGPAFGVVGFLLLGWSVIPPAVHFSGRFTGHVALLPAVAVHWMIVLATAIVLTLAWSRSLGNSPGRSDDAVED